MKIGRCPVCGGRLDTPDPDPNLATADYECMTCRAQVWLPEKVKEQTVVKQLDEKFFYFSHEPREILPSGPPKKGSGSKSAKNRNKNKGTKKFIDQWKLD